MSKEGFKELLHDQTSGGGTTPPGAATKLLGKLWDELAPIGAHGAHEMAAALLGSGSAFVMYPHEGKEDPLHGLPQEAAKEQSKVHEMEM
ncbi:hypothetical protein [Zavarzinella formosa]|uniref:hypothetical protein n=1 Tax=Zavarzinella formosa TaxID=360055 RepID=UPI000301276C|nr:hypothetical protein [Zavarzinella formosa]